MVISAKEIGFDLDDVLVHPERMKALEDQE
jgi:hypothetical protein